MYGTQGGYIGRHIRYTGRLHRRFIPQSGVYPSMGGGVYLRVVYTRVYTRFTVGQYPADASRYPFHCWSVPGLCLSDTRFTVGLYPGDASQTPVSLLVLARKRLLMSHSLGETEIMRRREPSLLPWYMHHPPSSRICLPPTLCRCTRPCTSLMCQLDH